MDTVYLLIDGKRIERFKSYSIEANIFTPDDAFSLELADPEVSVRAGMDCQIYVNDVLELTGVVDRVTASRDKAGRKLTVTGRDLMGWLVDAHVEEFVTLKNIKLSAVAERLLKKAPKEFFRLKTINYQEDVKGRLKGRASKVATFDTTTPLSQVEPGMTVFEVLSQYAKSRGLLFWLQPDGTFVFGKPKETGAAAFSIVYRRDGRGNNALSGELVVDLSKRYSKITVVGQQQGADEHQPSQVNVGASRTDPDFPFFKPYVIKDEYGGENPALQARLAMEKMRHDGFRLSYTVPGHAQSGKNWAINELCDVTDEDPNFALSGAYLIYGRTFERSKDQGSITKLSLGLPGMIG